MKTGLGARNKRECISLKRKEKEGNEQIWSTGNKNGVVLTFPRKTKRQDVKKKGDSKSRRCVFIRISGRGGGKGREKTKREMPIY